MAGRAPSNTDIMQILGRVEQKVDNVIQLAEKTNGRVTAVENWKNAIEAVERYKKEQPATVHTENGNVTVQATAAKLDAQAKLILAAAGLVSTLATAVGIYLGVNR